MRKKSHALITTIAVLMALSPLIARADGRSRIEYECAHLDRQRDGIACVIRDGDMGPMLFIRIYTLQGDPKEKWARTNYMIDTVSHNFVAAGGVWIKKLKISPTNARVERTCSRGKHDMEIYCESWVPAIYNWN